MDKFPYIIWKLPKRIYNYNKVENMEDLKGLDIVGIYGPENSILIGLSKLCLSIFCFSICIHFIPWLSIILV